MSFRSNCAAIRAPKRAAAQKRIGGWRNWLARLLPVAVEKLMFGEEVTIRALAEAVGSGDAKGLQYVGNVLGEGTKGKGLGLWKAPDAPSRLLVVQENADNIRDFLGDAGLETLLAQLGKTTDEWDAWRDLLPLASAEYAAAINESESLIRGDASTDNS